MTDKELNEQYWLLGVEDAMLTAQALFEKKIYHHALFYCQLAVEKQLKALVIKNRNRAAPTIHDLVDLATVVKINTSKFNGLYHPPPFFLQPVFFLTFGHKSEKQVGREIAGM